ncbi:MAG: hypothetical protein SVX43_14350, partial [Cyanobacteriota bacterium]|nr:hypothetical protein [Cyanobacteriota bacterium]
VLHFCVQDRLSILTTVSINYFPANGTLTSARTLKLAFTSDNLENITNHAIAGLYETRVQEIGNASAQRKAEKEKERKAFWQKIGLVLLGGGVLSWVLKRS